MALRRCRSWQFFLMIKTCFNITAVQTVIWCRHDTFMPRLTQITYTMNRRGRSLQGISCRDSPERLRRDYIAGIAQPLSKVLRSNECISSHFTRTVNVSSDTYSNVGHVERFNVVQTERFALLPSAQSALAVALLRG